LKYLKYRIKREMISSRKCLLIYLVENRSGRGEKLLEIKSQRGEKSKRAKKNYGQRQRGEE
jgi:hypothetical protein